MLCHGRFERHVVRAGRVGVAGRLRRACPRCAPASPPCPRCPRLALSVCRRSCLRSSPTSDQLAVFVPSEWLCSSCACLLLSLAAWGCRVQCCTHVLTHMYMHNHDTIRDSRTAKRLPRRGPCPAWRQGCPRALFLREPRRMCLQASRDTLLSLAASAGLRSYLCLRLATVSGLTRQLLDRIH